MAELSYMPFFVRDWLADTQDLSPWGYMAYHRILCAMWESRDNCLPNDQRILRNRAGISPQKWPSVWPEIEGFFTTEGDRITQQRIGKVKAKVRGKVAARSLAGRKGAAAKWRKTNGAHDGKANGKGDAIQNKTISKDIGEPYLDFSEASVQAIKSGKRFLCGSISASQARAMIQAELVTEDECKSVGVL